MSEIHKLAAMYRSGMSLKKIGSMIGRSHQYAYRRLKNAGVELRPSSAGGERHSQWKGGRLEAGQGYFRVWVAADDPMAAMRTHQGYVLEHRLVLARALGRPLQQDETVHHINGDRADNSPGNLQLRQGRHGKGVVMCCLECGSRKLGFTET